MTMFISVSFSPFCKARQKSRFKKELAGLIWIFLPGRTLRIETVTFQTSLRASATLKIMLIEYRFIDLKTHVSLEKKLLQTGSKFIFLKARYVPKTY